MGPFEYLKPTSLKEACSLLSEHKGEAKLIAGGQSLVPLLRSRLIEPRYIVDIKGIPGLEYIRVEPDGIRIGALTTHRDVEASSLVGERFPVLVDMERVLGTTQIRNWGTIGGDLCHADPAGDPAPALIALRAKVKAMSIRGQREMSLEQFFIDYFETVLEPDEILTEIQIPNPQPHTGTVYLKESVRLGDYPIISVAADVTLNHDKVKDTRIVLGAVGNSPIRAEGGEKALIGKEVTRAILEELSDAIAEDIYPASDIGGSAEYKRHLARVITKKVVSQAVQMAKQHRS